MSATIRPKDIVAAKTIINNVGTEITGYTLRTGIANHMCDDDDCKINKNIKHLPKRHKSQFNTEIHLYAKPAQTVDQNNVIYELNGRPATVKDIMPNKADSSKKQLYRIVPNTHAHLINYVYFDDDNLKKLPSAKIWQAKLLQAQRSSIEEWLKMPEGRQSHSQIQPVSLPVLQQPTSVELTGDKQQNLDKTAATTAAMPAKTTDAAAHTTADSAKKSDIVQMQEELSLLRQTVARLAEGLT